jgi:hypothetical protein
VSIVAGPILKAQDPICAQVQIQIDQSAVLTRTAFKATLKVTNTTDAPLEQVLVNIDIRDTTGAPANHRFDGLDGVYTISGFTIPGVNGTGVVPAAAGGQPAVATAEWLILPKDTATFDENPQRYTVGGVVSHTQIGVPVAVPLFPVPIDVYPDAKLFLKYYLQSPVYADSPFTLPVEAPEPYSLALAVRNDGFGAARDFRITSGQPYIIDNAQGLLVNFQLIGAQVGNQPTIPCLTLDFGDVPPGGSTIGRWIMTSSLTGFFSNYDVTFTHVNPLGGDSVLSAETSLIGGVDIFELDHVVQLEGPGHDALPDFLVHDPPQVQPLVGVNCDPQSINDAPPNEIHLSDGITELPLESIESAVFSGPPTTQNIVVQMTVHCSQPGWNLIRVDDPAQGNFGIQTVRRVTGQPYRKSISLGAPGDVSNAWTTRRWVPLNCDTPTLQHRLHVLDYLDRPIDYVYELTYLPDLQVVDVRLNSYDGYIPTRSNVTDLVVRFTSPINAPELIATNRIDDAFRVARREPGGGYQYADLPPSVYSWDPANNAVTIDLTLDGPGGDKTTRLRNGNFELQIRTDLVSDQSSGAPLNDNDGNSNDGVFRFGTTEGHKFFRLLGDTNADRRVDALDRMVVELALGSTPNQPNWNPNADVIPDGLIDLRDKGVIGLQSGATLAFQ